MSNELECSSDDPSKNQHVVDAIKAYCNFPYPQRHALMINGKWGSGKTFLIEAAGNMLLQDGPDGEKIRPLRITLFGVKDASEIGDQIYQQLHPVLASKSAKLVGAVIKGLLKTTVKIDLDDIRKGDLSIASELPDIKLSELLNGAERRVIIFDDFERARMTKSELLGYINPLVEHDGCKVIIIANEDEIHEDTYGRWKEKVVGQTLEVMADVAVALPKFLKEIDIEGLRSFYDRNRAHIAMVFRDSGLGNLRLLKNFLWDFEKFWAVLDERHRENGAAMLEVMAVLCAYTLELRSSRVSKVFTRSLVAIEMSAMVGNAVADHPFLTMSKRYSSVNFDSALIAPNVIEKIICKSTFPITDIVSTMDGHPYFATPKEMASWRALWFGFEFPEKDLPDILLRFNKDFETRQFIVQEEILHITGLCLWLSEIREPTWPAETVEARIQAYVEDVFDKRQSTADDVIPPIIELDMGAYGLAFRKAEDATFRKIASFLEDRVRAWRDRGLPSLAETLLELMSTDTDTFMRKISVTASGSATYARYPVMVAVPIDEFVSRFLKLSYGDRKNVLFALSMRFEHLNLTPDLEREAPWIKKLYEALMAYCDSLEPLPKALLSQRIRMYLEKVYDRALSSCAQSQC